MKLTPAQLMSGGHHIYYLSGEDRDALMEAGEALLMDGDAAINRLRVDVGELGRIEEETRNLGLFGSSTCFALVRNADAANPKQTEHLLRLVEQLSPEHRLIVCAPEVDWKKALHKQITQIAHVACCEFHQPNEAEFARWFRQQLQTHHLDVTDDALAYITSSLLGMRGAARQLLERMRWYDHGEGVRFTLPLIGDLLGERSPQEMDDYCAAVASRSSQALALLRHLVRDQQVAPVQVLSWLGMRIQQLLLVRWYQSRNDHNQAQKARVFGEARKTVLSDAKRWKGSELTEAMQALTEVEKQLKGASLESDLVLLERLTLQLVRPAL